MNRKLHQYKRFWLLILVMSYLLLGFFYAPQIIKQQISTQLTEQLDMQSEMNTVKFNPLTFSTEIEGLRITDANQQTWYDSQLTTVNFDPLNLIWGQWKFSDLNLVQPKITLVTDQAGQVLIPALPDFSESTVDSESIDFSIDQINLSQGRMNLQAGNIKQDFSLNFKNIEINHDKFSLTDENTRFDIKVTTENDETIALIGEYNHFKQVINTELILTGWQASTLNQVLPDELGINNKAGLIQASGDIDWTLTEKPLISFSNIKVQDLETQLPNDLSISQLQVTLKQVVVDTEAQTIQIGDVISNQAEWQVNWPMYTSHQAVIEQQATEVETQSSKPEWQVSIEQTNVADWVIEFIDNQVNANMTFSIKSLELLNANNMNQAITVYSQLHPSEESALSINSDLTLSPLNINANVNLAQFPLQKLTPWISHQTSLAFTQGQLNATQRITFQGGEFASTGRLSINDAIIQNQNAEVIADWNNLTIGYSSVSSQTETVIFDQITLDQATGLTTLSTQDTHFKDLKVSDSKNNDDNNSLNQGSMTQWTIKIGDVTNSQDSLYK